MKTLWMDRRAFAALAGAGALALLGNAAFAQDAGGVKFDPAARVAGKDLKLNGTGLRTRLSVRVYAMGLYLPEKTESAAEAINQPGPKRFTLAMLREVSGEDFGQAFMSGINSNNPAAERNKFVNQMGRFGEIFVNVGLLKKGDVLHGDWVPGSGMQLTLNGKSISEPLPEAGFYNAVLRIWLGDKPVDASLKQGLMGGK
jgi:hypothetical protein